MDFYSYCYSCSLSKWPFKAFTQQMFLFQLFTQKKCFESLIGNECSLTECEYHAAEFFRFSEISYGEHMYHPVTVAVHNGRLVLSSCLCLSAPSAVLQTRRRITKTILETTYAKVLLISWTSCCSAFFCSRTFLFRPGQSERFGVSKVGSTYGWD